MFNTRKRALTCNLHVFLLYRRSLADPNSVAWLCGKIKAKRGTELASHASRVVRVRVTHPFELGQCYITHRLGLTFIGMIKCALCPCTLIRAQWLSRCKLLLSIVIFLDLSNGRINWLFVLSHLLIPSIPIMCIGYHAS